jgi:hypothetical protein
MDGLMNLQSLRLFLGVFPCTLRWARIGNRCSGFGSLEFPFFDPSFGPHERVLATLLRFVGGDEGSVAG